MAYYVYILTNKHKSVFYTGVTNNLDRRLDEHVRAINKGFTQKYKCKYLIYYEVFSSVIEAIRREKQIKKYRKEKKINLVNGFNPEWKFLNEGPLKDGI